MNKFALAVLAGVFVATMGGVTQPAAADPYAWCVQYGSEDGGGGRNCGFVSREQCMETARGAGGQCEPNMFYNGPAERAAKPARKRPADRG
jgi:Protein of unknown function (DUF3551)